MKTSQHKLFRAMVVMSGGVVLGCGLTSQDPDDDGGSPSGGSAGAASGAGTGGSSGSTSSKGGAGSGGTLIIGKGGSGGSAGTQPGPFPCEPEQWDCSGIDQTCNYDGNGFELPQGCACDESRPTSPADCDGGELLVCRNATSYQGAPLEEPIPFECSCAAPADYCQTTCTEVFPDLYDASCQQDANPILCGCAVIVLR
jgi:hypothetical protein